LPPPAQAFSGRPLPMSFPGAMGLEPTYTVCKKTLELCHCEPLACHSGRREESRSVYSQGSRSCPSSDGHPESMKMPEVTPLPNSPSPLPCPLGRGKRGRGERVRGILKAQQSRFQVEFTLSILSKILRFAQNDRRGARSWRIRYDAFCRDVCAPPHQQAGESTDRGADMPKDGTSAPPAARLRQPRF